MPDAAPRIAIVSGDKGKSAAVVDSQEVNTAAGTTGKDGDVVAGKDSAGNGQTCFPNY